MLFLCDIANVAQKTFEIVQNQVHVNIMNYIERTSTARTRESRDFHSTCEELRDVSRKWQLTLCAVMAS